MRSRVRRPGHTAGIQCANFGAPEGIYSGKSINGDVQPTAATYTIADLNGDGKPDLFQLGGLDAYYSMTLLNDGKGRFSFPITSTFGAAASQTYMGDYRLGDFRNTGHLDVVGIGVNAAYTTSSQVLWFQPGNGDGTFGTATATPISGAAGAMTTGDFNGDGKLDFVTVNGVNKHILTPFFGNADGTFRAGRPLTFTDQNYDISRVYTGDFNRDGKLDVMVFPTSNGYWAPFLAVWEIDGNGDGTFKSPRQLYSGFQPFTLADLNNDGHSDIVRYDTFWPDGTTQTFAPPKITTYLGQADGSFSQSHSYSPYPVTTPIDLAPYLEFGDQTYPALAADYTGDGNVDVAAFQEGNAYGRHELLLAGNGDGTLTPTYDIFAFPSYTYPLQAYDFNHDGRADQLMFDNGGGNTITVPGAPAPALQMGLQNYIINGNSNCGVVFANVPSSSARTIILSSSISGVLLPGSIVLPGGALSAQFCYTLASTYDQSRVHDIQATLDGDTATLYASQFNLPPFAVSLSAAQTNPIYQGQKTDPVTVSINPRGGYTGTLKLACSGLPSGFSCSFSPSQVSVSAGATVTSQMVVQTASGFTGEMPITIVADDGVSIERQLLNLQIADLTISAMAPNAFVQDTSPGTTTTHVTVTGIPPYSLSCSGLPAGGTCQFSGTQSPYPELSDLTVEVILPAGISPTNSTFTVTAQSGSRSAQVSETLSVFSFDLLAPSTKQDWAPSPSSPTVSFPFEAANLGGAPATIGCSLDGTAVCQTTNLGVNSSTTSISTVLNIPSGIAAGQHSLVISANVAGIQQTYSFPFWIADFSGTLEATTLSTTAGGSVSVNGTLSATSAFSSSIVLSCSSIAQVSCAFQPSPLNLVGGTTTNFTATLKASSLASNHSPVMPRRASRGVALALLLPAAFALFWARRYRRPTGLFLLLAAAIGLGVSSCGGGGGTSSNSGGGTSHPPTSYSVTVVARDSSFGIEHNVGTISVTVTH